MRPSGSDNPASPPPNLVSFPLCCLQSTGQSWVRCHKQIALRAPTSQSPFCTGLLQPGVSYFSLRRTQRLILCLSQGRGGTWHGAGGLDPAAVRSSSSARSLLLLLLPHMGVKETRQSKQGPCDVVTCSSAQKGLQGYLTFKTQGLDQQLLLKVF